ncbi:MAG: FAD-dependent oxidoreductase [Caulobacterales bacterium]
MRFDIIVVGGGSAGCVMAARLSEDERLNVLLIEAGESDHHGFTKIPSMMNAAINSPEFDWRFRAEPDPSIGDRADYWPAGKCLGGGSAINGMTFMRGHRADYDRWAKEGAAGWDYESVLPYFKRLEDNERGVDDYRGGDGPQRVAEGRAHSHLVDDWIEAAIETGIPRSPDLNGARPEGVDFVQVTQKNGVRHSTAAAFLEPALKRKNLEIITNAQVTRIRFDGARAIGIDYVQHNLPQAISAARGIVVCAGALNTPKLLMQSGLGPGAHLASMDIEVLADLPGVGKNLQERPGALLVQDVNVPTLNTESRGFGAIKQALDFGLNRQGAMTLSMGQAHAFLRTRRNLPSPNVHLAFAAFATELDDEGSMKMRRLPSISTFVSICHPNARGEILLRGNDPLAPPVIRHELLGDEDDAEQLAEALIAARMIAAKPALSKYITGEVTPSSPISNKQGLIKYLHKAAAPSFHAAGTCKIGVDAMAVVDPKLKVHGADGLWVADASAMPSLVSGGTAAAAIMIGERGSDLIGAALRS